jgi:hypothetical protein
LQSRKCSARQDNSSADKARAEMLVLSPSDVLFDAVLQLVVVINGVFIKRSARPPECAGTNGKINSSQVFGRLER